MDNQFTPPQNTPPSYTLITPEKPKMKIWKKIVIFFILLVVLGITVFYNIPRILSMLYSNDAVLVDNSNLLLKKISVPDSDNGFFDLNKITDDMLKIPKNSENLAFSSEYSDFTKPIKWDQKLVDQVLKDNEQALSLFDQASNKKYFQIPNFTDPADIGINTEFPKMNSWRTVAQLQAIKSKDLALKGKSDQALAEAVKIIKLGSNIISGQNSLIGTLVGVAIKQQGSKTIFYILPNSNSKKEVLTSTINNLNNSSDDLEGYKNALRFEYAVVTGGINIVESTIEKEINEIIKQGEINPEYAKYAKYNYYFKPNQSINLFTDLYNTEVSAVGKKCELLDLDIQLKLDNDKFVSQVESNLMFTENAIGKMLFTISGVSLSSVLTKQCQTDFILNVAKIQLALKSYKIDNKSLPASLNDLVPKYISSVPKDPFDGQPIKYSMDKKILYSVGLKQKDLGGSTGDDWSKMDNPTIKIEF